MGGHYRLLAVATAISSILSSAHGGEAADPRSKTDPVSVGSGSSGTSLAPALGLFERAKAALECNVCKVSYTIDGGRLVRRLSRMAECVELMLFPVITNPAPGRA